MVGVRLGTAKCHGLGLILRLHVSCRVSAGHAAKNSLVEHMQAMPPGHVLLLATFVGPTGIRVCDLLGFKNHRRNHGSHNRIVFDSLVQLTALLSCHGAVHFRNM